MSGKNKEYVQIVNSVGVHMEVYKDNLTKLEAIELESHLIKTLPNLTNKNKHHTHGRELRAEDFTDKFYIDPISPSGLRWKMDRYNQKTKGALLASKDSVVGHKNPLGYWVTGNRPTHRIVYAIHNGVCPEHMTIDHLDMNKDNNSIENLEAVTASENSRRANKGREGKRGELNSAAKITREDVLSMYVMFDQGLSNKQVGDLFDLHDRYVSLVRHGKRWAWLYKEVGKQYPDSRTRMKISYKQVEDAYILLELGLSNKDIGDIAGIEVSQVSRLRSGTSLKIYKDRAIKNVDITIVK